MTLAALAGLSQIADALAYRYGISRGLVEANPIAAAIGDPITLLVLKAVAGLILAAGSLWLVHQGRSRAVAWISCIGFVGALSGVWAAA